DFFSITVFTLPMVAAWYYISSGLNKGYRTTLQNTLTFAQSKSGTRAGRAHTVNEVLNNGLESADDGIVMYVLKLVENLEPALFENVVVSLAGSDSPKIREYLEQRVRVNALVQGRNDEVHGLA